MIFAEVLPLEIFVSRHLRFSPLSFTTNLLFAMIMPLVGSTRHGKNQCSRKIATVHFSWCKPLVQLRAFAFGRDRHSHSDIRSGCCCRPPIQVPRAPSGNSEDHAA